MKLTTEQEENLICQYDRLLWKMVHHFCGKHRRGYENKEDLHSECVLVFLRHIRSCKTMEEIRRVPTRDMMNAMCVYIIGEQPVSYPKRTAQFRQIISQSANQSSTDGKNTKAPNDICGDVVDKIMFLDFFRKLPAKDREIIQMKLDGCKNREIAISMGFSDTQITRIIQRIRRHYREYAA